MEQNTVAQRQRLRQAYIEFGLAMQPNAFVTLVTNDSTKTKPRPKKPQEGPPKALTWRYQGEPQKSDLSRHLDMTHLIGEFLAMMDRALLGRNWSRLPANDRTDGIFIIEHTDTNIHAHGLLRFPEAKTLCLENLTKGKWSRLTQAGDAKYQALYEAENCIEYCTKEMKGFLFSPDQVVLARQFMAT